MIKLRYDGVTIRTEDYTNGDVCVYVIKDEEILYTSYLARGDRQIVDRDYITGEQTITKCEKLVVENDSVYISELNSGRITKKYTSAGSIGYILSVKKEGNYYATNSITKHDNKLALKLGKLYYPGMTSYTVKWA